MSPMMTDGPTNGLLAKTFASNMTGEELARQARNKSSLLAAYQYSTSSRKGGVRSKNTQYSIREDTDDGIFGRNNKTGGSSIF